MATFTNKRKTGGGSNSDGSSNASSPSVSINNSASTQYYPHLTTNAPKNGVVIPNRVFVGGIASNTTEAELTSFFSRYGHVKDVKIIVDRAGVSKGYGFVTFDTEEEANKLQHAADDVNFQGRRLNIAAAIKKQACLLQPYCSRTFDGSSASPPMPPNVYFHNGIPYTYHNGMAFFSSGNPPSNAVAPLPAHPETVNIYPGTFGPPHGNAPTPSFGPTMMYHPCPNPPPSVYLPAQQYTYPPLPFDSYYQVASQSSGIMFSTGAGPTSVTNTGQAQNSLVAGPDNGSGTQALQLLPTQPNPMYAPPHILHDIYYPAQGVYPMGAVDGMTPYSDIPTEESPSSNLSAEGSACSKTESENVAHSTLATNIKHIDTHVTNMTSAPPLMQCERFECIKSINNKRTNLNDSCHEPSTPTSMYSVTVYNPVFSKPPVPRYSHPTAISGYQENQSRIRNFIPCMYSVEPRRSFNLNVPKQQLCVNNNNINTTNNNYSGIKTSEPNNQNWNGPRLPRYQRGRAVSIPPQHSNRFAHPVSSYFPRFHFQPNQQPQLIPLPPPPITPGRRFPGPMNRKTHVNIPIPNNVTNNNNNTNTSNNNFGGNCGINRKVNKPVSTSVSTSKSEPEIGAGDAPPIVHHSNVTSAVSGPTPIELSHQMQKLST